jgi:predicted AAA+ superfamily ATPase
LNEGKKAGLTYFRDKNGFEVDFIADWKHSCAIEVKSESFSENKLSANVKKYVGMRGDGTTGTVFYLGDFSCSIAGVEYVSWRDWGDFYNKFA